jgi:cytochrome P450
VVAILSEIIEKRKSLPFDKDQDSCATASEHLVQDDMMQAFISEAQRQDDPACYLTYSIITRIVMLYIASITAPLNSFSTVERLLKNPEWIGKLRMEALDMIPDVSNIKSWTLDDLNKLKLHDAFIREALRMEPMMLIAARKVATSPKGYTFSDGLQVPENVEVSIPVPEYHFDPLVYPKPDDFYPQRYFEREDERLGLAAQATTISNDYLAWGAGSHVW